MHDQQCQTLETAQHFLLTTAWEKAGEGGFLEEECARLDGVGEALLPLQILRGRKQLEQCVQTQVAKVVAMTLTTSRCSSTRSSSTSTR